MTAKERLIDCIKLKRKAVGLNAPPYPGELGDTIYHHISREAWQSWLEYLTMLTNEGRLAIDQSDTKDMLKREMIQFLNLDAIDSP